MRAHCLQHVPFEGLAAIDVWLRRAGARVSTTRFYDRPDLPDPADVDFLIVMGGPMSVNDEAQYPWILGERRFIREVIDRGAVVLGVCLGSQLIASALGMRVYPNRMKEIGWFPVTGASVEPGWPEWTLADRATTVFHWHGETFDLPPGAVHLARSEACAHQAFAVGRRVLGLQFHLEVTPAAVADMVRHGRDELRAAPFVQSEADILAADTARLDHANAILFETLDRLTESLSRSPGGPAAPGNQFSAP
jgi:GMP synthase-like glutamine amidotransferase